MSATASSSAAVVSHSSLADAIVNQALEQSIEALVNPSLEPVEPEPEPEPNRARRTAAEKKESEMTALRPYLDALGHYQTFSPDQEKQAAERIAAARVQRWHALLSYSPLYEQIRGLLESRFQLDPTTRKYLDKLAVSADLYRRRRTLTNEQSYFADIDRVAPRLPAFDVDSELAERLINDVDRISHEDRTDLLIEVARMPGNSRPFRDWVARCRECQEEVRRETNAFAHANLRLVISLARRLGHGRLPLADLIQEGNLGLLKAIERFDPQRGFRFSTYAGWWIRHSISRAIYNKGRQVRLPVHVHDMQQKLAKVRRQFEAERGREPTLEELAKETGIEPDKIEKVNRLECGPVSSLDEPVASGDDRSGIELLEDDTPAPSARIEFAELEEGLEAALEQLRPMEADILRRRFGLDGYEPETLREIGERYALSRERIRQLQDRAVRKIRSEFRSMQLM